VKIEKTLSSSLPSTPPPSKPPKQIEKNTISLLPPPSPYLETNTT